MMFRTPALLLGLVSVPMLATVAESGVDCVAPCDENGVCTYTAKVDLFASELGYFTFEECGTKTNPTIGIQKSKTYKFVQSDRSNFFHPLGFAYFPDGAHDDKDELEPGIVPPGSSSACGADMTCPAPMYFKNGAYLGEYSNLLVTNSTDALVASAIAVTGSTEMTTNKEDFGLDFYEPLFFHPIGDWLGYGEFEILLKFDVEDYTDDMFYFCHIHQFMSGRIKFVDENGDPLNAEDTPPLGYNYDAVDGFDKMCGTFNTSIYQLPHDQCPDKFVCDIVADDGDSTAVSRAGDGHDVLGSEDYAACIDAMNCAMVVGMTSDARHGPLALFIHQMIPHHQNAVNMAKATMKAGVSCENLDNEDDPNCIMERILREIVNGQNAQIQAMRAVLDQLDHPQFADCEVPVFGIDDISEPLNVSASSLHSWSWCVAVLAIIGSLWM